jgi:hypothetical protein
VSVHPSPERTTSPPGTPRTHARPGNWGGRIGVATEAPRTQPPRPRKPPPPAAHPPAYVERRLLIWDIDCNALLHRHLEDIVKEETRHMPPSAQAVARVHARDCTVGGDYYWSNERVARRAGCRRETVNRIERRLCGDIEILVKSVHQRRGRGGPHAAPKTRKLHPRIMREAMKRTMRSLARSVDHTRKAKPSVEAPRGASPGLPPLEGILPRFKRPRPYSGGYMVCCPAHADRHASLSISEGRNGKLLLFCHAGCSHARVRAVLGLPPPRKARVTLSAPKARLRRLVERLTPSRLPPGWGVEWLSGRAGPVPFDTREPAPAVS